jgi:hypothetical protein
MICKICHKEFTPSKYRPQQRVCLQPECQHQRQLANMSSWRMRNPDYFRFTQSLSSWKRRYSECAKRWRQTHAEYLRKYRQLQKPIRRIYMREYMREYRKRQKMAAKMKEDTTFV